jgi:hypothetical protein
MRRAGAALAARSHTCARIMRRATKPLALTHACALAAGGARRGAGRGHHPLQRPPALLLRTAPPGAAPGEPAVALRCRLRAPV